jgi:biopolymer transport protein ExbD
VARRRTPVPGDKVEINVIALVDIAFLIIVFLLVTSEFSSRDRIEKLELPAAFEVKPETAERDRLIVGIDRLGKIIVSRRPVSLDELKSMFELERKRALRNKSITEPGDRMDQRILLQADRNAHWQVVQDVLEAAAESKFHNISFSVKKDGSSRTPRP